MKRFVSITAFMMISGSFTCAASDGVWWWAIPSGIVTVLLIVGYVVEGK